MQGLASVANRYTNARPLQKLKTIIENESSNLRLIDDVLYRSEIIAGVKVYLTVSSAYDFWVYRPKSFAQRRNALMELKDSFSTHEIDEVIMNSSFLTRLSSVGLQKADFISESAPERPHAILTDSVVECDKNIVYYARDLNPKELCPLTRVSGFVLCASYEDCIFAVVRNFDTPLNFDCVQFKPPKTMSERSIDNAFKIHFASITREANILSEAFAPLFSKTPEQPVHTSFFNISLSNSDIFLKFSGVRPQYNVSVVQEFVPENDVVNNALKTLNDAARIRFGIPLCCVKMEGAILNSLSARRRWTGNTFLTLLVTAAVATEYNLWP